jgi:hypothetical protein
MNTRSHTSTGNMDNKDVDPLDMVRGGERKIGRSVVKKER